ncbi:MAG: DUF6515 family protein [Planctomycetota bacterium JB042]
MKLRAPRLMAASLIAMLVALAAVDAFGGRGSLKYGKKSRMPWRRFGGGDSYPGESRKSSADRRPKVRQRHTLQDKFVSPAPDIDPGTLFAEPPAGSQRILASGKSYAYHGGLYYQRMLVSGKVAYRVVEPPFGAVVDAIPSGAVKSEEGGKVHFKVGDTTYRRILRNGEVAYIVSKAG